MAEALLAAGVDPESVSDEILGDVEMLWCVFGDTGRLQVVPERSVSGAVELVVDAEPEGPLIGVLCRITCPANYLTGGGLEVKLVRPTHHLLDKETAAEWQEQLSTVAATAAESELPALVPLVGEFIQLATGFEAEASSAVKKARRPRHDLPPSPALQMPFDCWMGVAEALSPLHLASAAASGSALHAILYDSDMWEWLYHTHFPVYRGPKITSNNPEDISKDDTERSSVGVRRPLPVHRWRFVDHEAHFEHLALYEEAVSKAPPMRYPWSPMLSYRFAAINSVIVHCLMSMQKSMPKGVLKYVGDIFMVDHGVRKAEPVSYFNVLYTFEKSLLPACIAASWMDMYHQTSIPQVKEAARFNANHALGNTNIAYALAREIKWAELGTRKLKLLDLPTTLPEQEKLIKTLNWGCLDSVEQAEVDAVEQTILRVNSNPRFATHTSGIPAPGSNAPNPAVPTGLDLAHAPIVDIDALLNGDPKTLEKLANSNGKCRRRRGRTDTRLVEEYKVSVQTNQLIREAEATRSRNHAARNPSKAGGKR